MNGLRLRRGVMALLVGVSLGIVGGCGDGTGADAPAADSGSSQSDPGAGTTGTDASKPDEMKLPDWFPASQIPVPAGEVQSVDQEEILGMQVYELRLHVKGERDAVVAKAAELLADAGVKQDPESVTVASAWSGVFENDNWRVQLGAMELPMSAGTTMLDYTIMDLASRK